ncbi:helix-turn-helix domain-containing protein [Flavobacteriaceae bacterium 14752]|uniref:helix-turn-helix domain-containing protein n=1 Tax=Mesohalobacter salilacus TaxID=2491711 RepID=UPI000F641044|nr:helix-turn-helix domain-containing protein [Flavobacteriaceae bacterium 14752]
MKNIGQKIKSIRKQKGFSQEELADRAKVNLRTIQRIENVESEPRGKTLQLICKVLEVNIEDILDYGKQTDRNFLVIFHLSVLSCLVIPIGNIILPLILWMNKKDKIIGLHSIGANLLNFQIVWTVVSFSSIITFALFKIMHYGNYEYFFFIFIGLYVVNIVLPIIFAVKANKGQTQIYYPKLIKFVR